MYDNAYGAVDNTVRGWVRDLINGLYGYLHMIYGDVGSAWFHLEGAALDYWRALTSFAGSVLASFAHLFKVLIPAIISEYRKLFTEAENFIKTVYDDALKGLDRVTHLIASTADALWQTILRDVWRPLLGSLTDAWTWIKHEGATAWYYISNPAKLVDLIWLYLIAKLEREAWIIGSLLGKFFLSLIIHNLKRLALLIEDILNAVL